jgi:hypothetical protein
MFISMKMFGTVAVDNNETYINKKQTDNNQNTTYKIMTQSATCFDPLGGHHQAGIKNVLRKFTYYTR